MCYRLGRRKHRPIKMATISEGFSNQDIFIAEILVPANGQSLTYFLEVKYSTVSASMIYFALSKRSVSFVHEVTLRAEIPSIFLAKPGRFF